MLDERGFIKSKNLIDREYQKYLTYFELTTISGITAIIGVLIAYLTAQLNFIALFIAFVVTSIMLMAGNYFIFARIRANRQQLNELN